MFWFIILKGIDYAGKLNWKSDTLIVSLEL